MRAILIEDESNVRRGFVKLLHSFCPQVEVIGEAETLEAGLNLINTCEFDILFLDINLPDGSGFDLIYQTPVRNFHTIFVTAYDQYALDAFKVGAIDYLLKPVAPDELCKAVHRVENSKKVYPGADNINSAKSYMEENRDPSEKIILRDAESIYVVAFSEILYCNAEGAYTKFNFTDRDSIITSLNLKEYERLLEPYGFIRCHNSYLTNIAHITEVKKTDGGAVIMSNGKSLPLSFRKKPIVVKSLKDRYLTRL